MKKVLKVIMFSTFIIAVVLFSLLMSKWIWSWHIPEWMKVYLISSHN